MQKQEVFFSLLRQSPPRWRGIKASAGFRSSNTGCSHISMRWRFCIGIRECVTWLYWSYCVLWSLVVVLYPRRRSSVFELLIWRNRGTTLRFWHVMFTELLWGSWLYPGHTHNPYHHFSLWILSNSFILHYLHSCDDVLMLFFRFVELIPAGHWVSGLSVLVILVSLSP